MEKFTASNGVTVHTDVHGCVTVAGIESLRDSSQALREFFLHERDQELGRWRWPENPDYVVYLVGDDIVDVLRERSISDVSRGPGRQESISREKAKGWDKDYSQNFFAAARAYFAAHPERKPWHDAKDGEVWEVETLRVGHHPRGVVSKAHGEPATFVDPRARLAGIPVTSPEVVSARRIWPEENPCSTP